MKKIIKFGFGLFIGLILMGIIIGALGGGDDSTKEKASNEDTQTPESAEVEKPETEPEESKEENVPREYKSALKKAETYAKSMNLSKAGIYDQLTSKYGENFPVEATQYAMDNIVFHWKDNALKKAETYAETMSMSDAAIYDQLISEYGEKFTPEEAQYAIDNLK